MKNATIITTTENTVSRPVVAAAYASTSEVVVDSKVTAETMKKVVTCSGLGNYCKALATGKADFSKKAIMESAHLDANTVENLYSAAADIMGKVALMMDAREAAKECLKDTQGEKMVDNAEKSVKKAAEDLFYWIAWKPGKRHKDKKGNTVTDKEAFYKVRKADYSILGEMCSEAKATAGDATVIERFTGLFLLMAGRILTGKPMGRATAADLKTARAEAKKAIADKAKRTKKTNAETEEEKERKDNAEKAAKVEKVAQLGNLAMDAIRDSSATDDEKAQIIDLVKQLVLAAGK